MGFFDTLKTKFSELSAGLGNDLKKYKNKSVLQGMMAGCAYVAAADGEISPTEKQKMQGLVRNSSITSVYDADEAIKIFNEFAGKFAFEFEAGKSEALLAIGKLRGDPAVARLVIRGCIIIGGADGNFDDHEKAVVREICRELGQNPADFDL
jgi:tellurite resistance protein TerB